jgi:hypothetical protein
MVHCILGTHVHFNGTLKPSIHCLASAHRKSGYFGMEIIWRFCVKMGWLKIGTLYWVCFVLAATIIKSLNMPFRYNIEVKTS